MILQFEIKKIFNNNTRVRLLIELNNLTLEKSLVLKENSLVLKYDIEYKRNNILKVVYLDNFNIAKPNLLLSDLEVYYKDTKHHLLSEKNIYEITNTPDQLSLTEQQLIESVDTRYNALNPGWNYKFVRTERSCTIKGDFFYEFTIS